jgi:hypothetical protein
VQQVEGEHRVVTRATGRGGLGVGQARPQLRLRLRLRQQRQLLAGHGDHVGRHAGGQHLPCGWRQQGSGLPLDTSNFVGHAENTGSNCSLVRQGLGIGALMDDIARISPVDRKLQAA